ncbi:SDR family oxidoreductase [Streptomyces sp. NBC_01280]|uniref:SDR family oxidoreductase n=1 Tax=unclassified Streptomyces TaxID=2593676 RepID=UPI00224D1C37|nr:MULTISPECIES: SDR family oxidoreductase [unclassified Streptomyces]MCX5435222.1 SDR family oxidoreductase [Streptomyces sp. NBC_00063]WSE13051.1 SDR family oxidoreductase [Streptomyces sp. NBC_01397]WUB98004.1 SDR family oxidoreductase [Streptomyces sp. NBC_00569]
MEPVTLITGGSTGIGAATARALLKEGHRVAVTGRDPQKLAAFATSAGAGERLLTITGDTSDEHDVASAVRQVVDAWGRLDNVIANAGFSLPGTLENHAPEDMRAMVLTNVLGPALLVRETLPHLRESTGRIVIIGSVAGVRNTPGNLYSVTKWAAHALAENTRLLVGKDGVGVTVVAPGVVDTPFWDKRGGTPEAAPVMTAEHIADTIVFVVNQPAGVDINHITMRPSGQVG